MPLPDPSEYASFHKTYISLVPEEDIVATMGQQHAETLAILKRIAPKEWEVLHSPYTWTIKDVVNHLIDGERVFGYRALRFARGDGTPLPGFDENLFAQNVDTRPRSKESLIAEFDAIRRSHLLFFETLAAEAWSRRGTASGAETSVRAVAYILVGHVRHHMTIVQRRVPA